MRAFGRMGATGLLLQIAMGFSAQASESEHIRIQFSAPDKCPDQDAFERALRRRTAKFQIATDRELARQFAVTITFAGSTPMGRLAVHGPGAEPSERTVSGKSCEEVVAALALMTALAIDPGHVPTATRPTAIVSSTPSSNEARTPSPVRATAGITQETPIEAPAPTAEANPEESARSARVPIEAVSAEVAPREPWTWSVGMHGQATFHTGPTTGLGAALFIDASAPGDGLPSPALRLGLSANRSEKTLTSGAGATFTWTTLVAEGCPVRLVRPGIPLAFQPCLAVHVGLLRGQGENLDERAQATNLWADLGPVGRVRAAIAKHLVVEAQVTVLFPLRRITFEVQDAGPGSASSTVYAVPHIGARVGLGLAYEFR
jgi:hypothetical protein